MFFIGIVVGVYGALFYLAYNQPTPTEWAKLKTAVTPTSWFKKSDH